MPKYDAFLARQVWDVWGLFVGDELQWLYPPGTHKKQALENAKYLRVPVDHQFVDLRKMRVYQL